MSTLRDIMQRLAQVHPDAPWEEGPSTPALTEIGRIHVAHYQQHLEACSAAMLQYEWAWLDEHISGLELCLTQPEMLKIAGGKPHVEQLLLESRQSQAGLQALLAARSIEPHRPPRAVVTGDHAWEIRQESIKRLWGMD